MLEAGVELEQHEAPDRLIDGRVAAWILLDDKGLQVVRYGASARVDARPKRGVHLGILAQSRVSAGGPPEQGVPAQRAAAVCCKRGLICPFSRAMAKLAGMPVSSSCPRSPVIPRRAGWRPQSAACFVATLWLLHGGRAAAEQQGSPAPPAAASSAAASASAPGAAAKGALPSYFTVELAPDGTLFADGAPLPSPERLDAAARSAAESGRFVGAALFGEPARAANELTELHQRLTRAGFAEVLDVGRRAPQELSVASKLERDQRQHRAARERLVAAGVIEGDSAAPSADVASVERGLRNATPAHAEKAAPVRSKAEPTKAEPQRRVDKVELQSVGLHLAGPLEHERTRKQLLKLFEGQFAAFRRCHRSAPEHDYNASYGVDLLVSKEGGKAKVRETRTRLEGEAYRSFHGCMDRAFEGISFEPMPSGRDEIISYSVLFKVAEH
jgi:hypothetical protein